MVVLPIIRSVAQVRFREGGGKVEGLRLCSSVSRVREPRSPKTTVKNSPVRVSVRLIPGATVRPKESAYVDVGHRA